METKKFGYIYEMSAWLLVIWALTFVFGLKYFNQVDIIVGATCLSLEVLDEYYGITRRPKWKNLIVLVLCGAVLPLFLMSIGLHWQIFVGLVIIIGMAINVVDGRPIKDAVVALLSALLVFYLISFIVAHAVGNWILVL